MPDMAPPGVCIGYETGETEPVGRVAELEDCEEPIDTKIFKQDDRQLTDDRFRLTMENITASPR